MNDKLNTYKNRIIEFFNESKDKLYTLFHIRNDTDIYADYITNYGWIEEVTGNDDSILGLGADLCTQMLELNITLRSLKKEILNELPDYLKENLIRVETSGTIDNIRLNFYFKNYDHMNKKLVNEIRADFRDCIMTNKFPPYKVMCDGEFMLVVAVKDYYNLNFNPKEIIEEANNNGEEEYE
ncbi:MAG: hypothetical protein IJH63_00610 [Methanobrevibacter sp.]|nr:hypothetical protein [Methanosphaera sp.]MBR0369205.1 hypothetical protein [Methanobrevibacter sp.]